MEAEWHDQDPDAGPGVNRALALEGDIELACNGRRIQLRGHPDGCDIRFESLASLGRLALNSRGLLKSLITMRPVREIMRVRIFVKEVLLVGLIVGRLDGDPRLKLKVTR